MYLPLKRAFPAAIEKIPAVESLARASERSTFCARQVTPRERSLTTRLACSTETWRRSLSVPSPRGGDHATKRRTQIDFEIELVERQCGAAFRPAQMHAARQQADMAVAVEAQ